MKSRKIVFQETAVVLAGEIVCVGAMLGIYALLGYFSHKVLLGGIVGLVLATLNFFFMAVGTSLAADKAETQDVKGGQTVLQISMLIRYALLFVVLFAFLKSGLCNLLALLLPLVFVRPVLTLGEFFRKKGDGAS